MAIENRSLEVGGRLVARYKGETHTAEVVSGNQGVRYRLADGREFKSPSAAGSAVMGGTACNGWRFWSLESDVPEPVVESGGAKTARGRRLIVGVPNQKGVPEGQVRWFCTVCKKGFLAEAGASPEVCPEGHQA
jgi:Restriction Enzyme Adenine Methylase Associated